MSLSRSRYEQIREKNEIYSCWKNSHSDEVWTLWSSPQPTDTRGLFFQSLIDNDLVLVAVIRMTFYCVKKKQNKKNYWFSFDFITSLTLGLCIYLHIYIYMCVYTHAHIHTYIYINIFIVCYFPEETPVLVPSPLQESVHKRSIHSPNKPTVARLLLSSRLTWVM